MGCDIHTRVEYLNTNKEWVCGDFFRINPYYIGDSPHEVDPYSVVEVCDDRNYELFAVLADVRNYDGMPYIDEPRGIPDNACAKTHRDYNAWGEDAHSASWFTLKELIEYRAGAGSTIKRSGMVSPEDAEKLDATGEEPRMWCGYTSDKSWVYREWEVEYNPLDKLIAELKRRGEELYLWYSFHSEEEFMERADKLRFIFWFDN